MLALVLPGKAVAGPPEGVSGKMVLEQDKVSEALLKYRRGSDPSRRLALLTDLARVRDLGARSRPRSASSSTSMGRRSR